MALGHLSRAKSPLFSHENFLGRLSRTKSPSLFYSEKFLGPLSRTKSPPFLQEKIGKGGGVLAWYAR